MSIGSILRQRRESLDLTQDQVSDQAGISKPYLSNIETGKAKNPPTDGVLGSLERVLGFERGELTKMAHLARTPVDVRVEHDMLETEVQKLRSVVAALLAQRDGKEPAPRDDAGGIGLGAPSGPGHDGNVRMISAGVVVPIINKVAAGYPQHFTDLDYPASIADEYTRCPDLHDQQAFGARVVGDSMEPAYCQGDIVIFSPNTQVRNGNDCFVRLDDGQTTFKRFYQDDEQTIRLQPLNNKYPSVSYPRSQVTGLWPAVFRIERIR